MKTGNLGLWFLGFLLLAGCEAKIRVEGDSMLPTLVGGSVLEICPQCGYRSPSRPEGAFVCANCRWLVREEERGNLSAKERFYDHVILQNGKNPKRDDLVLVVSEEGTLAVKRVLGEPGDRVEIRDGKVWINGNRPLRSLEKWEENRILVHDDRFRPGGISRWQPSGKWECLPEGWQMETEAVSSPLFLTYHHAEGSFWGERNENPNPAAERFVPASITNLRSENGPQMRNEWIHVVDELGLSFQLSLQVKEGMVSVQLPLGETIHTFLLVSQPSVLAHWPIEYFQAGSWSVYLGNFPSGGKKEDWFFSTLDGVPRVWRNRQLQKECVVGQSGEYLPQRSEETPRPGHQEISLNDRTTGENFPIRIGFQGRGSVKWERITLFRGEYWLFYPPYFNKMRKLDGETLAMDGENGYYLTGDNCLVSRDSRLWGPIPSEKIRGVVRKWVTSSSMSLP